MSFIVGQCLYWEDPCSVFGMKNSLGITTSKFEQKITGIVYLQPISH